jgi:hypothetical protein
MQFPTALFYGSTLYFLLFSAYLELHPGLSNIWYRVCADGVRRVNLASYWHFITKPFTMPEFWYFKNWDLNYFIGAALLTLILYLV